MKNILHIRNSILKDVVLRNAMIFHKDQCQSQVSSLLLVWIKLPFKSFLSS